MLLRAPGFFEPILASHEQRGACWTTMMSLLLQILNGLVYSHRLNKNQASIKNIIPKRGTIELPSLEKHTLDGFLRCELFGFLLRTLNHQSNGKRTSKRSEIEKTMETTWKAKTMRGRETNIGARNLRETQFVFVVAITTSRERELSEEVSRTIVERGSYSGDVAFSMAMKFNRAFV